MSESARTVGLGGESDWQAVRIEDWRQRDAHLLLRCDIDMRVRYDAGIVTFDIARRCFERPGRIRVAATSSNGNQPSQRDWAPRHRHFYDWVRRSA